MLFVIGSECMNCRLVAHDAIAHKSHQPFLRKNDKATCDSLNLRRTPAPAAGQCFQQTTTFVGIAGSRGARGLVRLGFLCVCLQPRASP